MGACRSFSASVHKIFRPWAMLAAVIPHSTFARDVPVSFNFARRRKHTRFNHLREVIKMAQPSLHHLMPANPAWAMEILYGRLKPTWSNHARRTEQRDGFPFIAPVDSEVALVDSDHNVAKDKVRTCESNRDPPDPACDRRNVALVPIARRRSPRNQTLHSTIRLPPERADANSTSDGRLPPPTPLRR